MTGKVVENKNKSAQCFISNTAASIAPPVPEHISTTCNNLRARKGGARGGKTGFANSECFPPRISSALKSQKLYYQKLKTIFPTLLSQKRNILLRRKQLLKKSIQQHRIYKSYKSKSKEKPAACVKWLQLCIEIGHI